MAHNGPIKVKPAPLKLVDALKLVRPIPGEPMRMYIPSRSDSKMCYLVDLEEYDFNGACSCQDFQFNREKLLKNGATPNGETKCWHLKVGRESFLEKCLRMVAERMAGK